MAKSNEEPNSNLSINKPPLKKTKTLSSLNLRVSIAADNGIGNSSSSSTKTDFEQQQWNYPSFLGIGSTSRKRRPPPPPKPANLKPPASDFQTKPHSEPKTSSSSSSPPSIAINKQQQQHSISSPLFYLVSYFSSFTFYLYNCMIHCNFFIIFVQFIITCVIFVPYSAYLQYKLAKLKVLYDFSAYSL